MTWIGTWRNQHGSTVVITSEGGGLIEGFFRTGVEPSAFAGRDVPVVGTHSGNTVAFSIAATPEANVVVGHAGKLEGERLETLWFVVAGTKPWRSAVGVNHDTFERI